MLRSAVLHFYDTFFEFASPVALHGSGSDLNTSSLRSGDKERAQPGCCQKPHKKKKKGGREGGQRTSPSILLCACWAVFAV